MSSWKEGYLADLIKSLEQGVSVNSIDDNNINENTPLILKTSCVSAGFFDPTESKKIHPKDLGKQKLNPIADSILISRMNTPALVGASAYVNKTYKNIFLPDRLWMAVKKHDEVCMEWLSQIISSDYYWSKIRDRATGTSPSMKNISKKDLLKLPILIPSYAEQLEISKALKTWDTAIEKAEALIDAKERQFGWLVTRLINRSGHKKKLLSDFISEVSMRNRGNEIDRVLSVTNRNGFVLPEDQFERRVASANVTNYKIVKQGQYAYNPSRINVGSIARLDDWDDGILSPMYTVFKLDYKMADSDYFLHWLSSSEAKQRIKKSAQGSVRETVSFGDLGAIPICLPEIYVQKKIANTLNTAKEEINLLKKLADQYRTQKRGLMQKLLSGQWHVKNKEAA